MFTEVFTPRWPESEIVLRDDSIWAPGVNRVKSVKLRPRIGSESIAISSMLVDTCVFEVSITGA